MIQDKKTKHTTIKKKKARLFIETFSKKHKSKSKQTFIEWLNK